MFSLTTSFVTIIFNDLFINQYINYDLLLLFLKFIHQPGFLFFCFKYVCILLLIFSDWDYVYFPSLFFFYHSFKLVKYVDHIFCN